MSSISGDGESFSSGRNGEEEELHGPSALPQHATEKKKRNPPGNPDPNAEVIALSPKTLMATNRFVCEICHKGFQRDQNLQLHRRGHNLPWKLRQRTSTDSKKRVYVCPEPSCVHHNPARALGDLTGIKKHYSRKHGEKKWKCEKCSKKYAVQSDWKAHSKTCGTKEYKCDCGTIFSRRDSFVTHRAFCDALAEENNKLNNKVTSTSLTTPEFSHADMNKIPLHASSINMVGTMYSTSSSSLFSSPRNQSSSSSSCLQLSTSSSAGFNAFNDSKNTNQESGATHFSATALLQKAAQMGATVNSNISPPNGQTTLTSYMAPATYNGVFQQHSNNTYGDIQIENYQAQLAGLIDGYNTNSFTQKKTQESLAPKFLDHTGNGGDVTVQNPGTYNGLFSQNLDFANHMDGSFHADQSGSALNCNNPHLEIGMTRERTSNSVNLTKFAANSAGSNDSMTLDLLGMGGIRPTIFQEMQQQEWTLK